MALGAQARRQLHPNSGTQTNAAVNLKSQNRRVVWVGRDLWMPSSPTPLGQMEAKRDPRSASPFGQAPACTHPANEFGARQNLTFPGISVTANKFGGHQNPTFSGISVTLSPPSIPVAIQFCVSQLPKPSQALVVLLPLPQQAALKITNLQ